MRITDKTVALVTGGGSGLGESVVRRGIADGGKAGILDLPSSNGQALADSLGAAARFCPADVCDPEGVQAAVDAAKEMGELRILVNCAGIPIPGRIIGRKGVMPIEQFRKVIEVNLVGTFNVMRLATAAMVENEPVDGDRGVIVMTASVAAFDGQIGQVAYTASKAGIVGLTLPAARDLADKFIRVVTVAPGTFETPMLATLPDKERESLGMQVPHPARLGRPEEYAGLIAHIVDNGMLNGEVIRLDGAIRMAPR